MEVDPSSGRSKLDHKAMTRTRNGSRTGMRITYEDEDEGLMRHRSMPKLDDKAMTRTRNRKALTMEKWETMTKTWDWKMTRTRQEN